MKNILIVGAGRSSGVLVDYMLDQAAEHSWKIILAERDPDLVAAKIHGHAHGEAVVFDINDAARKRELISKADIVISMLPARYHWRLVDDCLEGKKHLVTASYQKSLYRIDQEADKHPDVQEREAWERLDATAREQGVLLISEMGLDPGIDHMSAMQMIDKIRANGGNLTSFKSFTGGLVAPGFDNNPWQYKLTWNPRNVVLAGQGTAQYIKNGRYKYIPYHKLFDRLEAVSIPGYGKYEGYPNRDSLSYRKIYGLEKIPTIFRGTLRKPGFCQAWNLLVQLGLTDDSYKLEDSANMTYREFVNTFLVYTRHKKVEEKVCRYLNIREDSPEFAKLQWLGLFDDKKIGLPDASPAQILQQLLEQKWKLEANDKDMIVMQHQFDYNLDGLKKRLHASLVVTGDDQIRTAMAKMVGLPVGIVSKLILNGTIRETGMHTPVLPSIYEPVLQELASFNIDFIEEDLSVEPEAV